VCRRLPLGPTPRPVRSASSSPPPGIALTTGLCTRWRDVAPVVALGVLYLLVVLLVSSVWARAGIASALAAPGVQLFHLPPTGRLTIAEARQLGSLGVFSSSRSVVVARGAARARARECRNAAARPTSPEMARLLLRGGDLHAALATAAQRLASALGWRRRRSRVRGRGATRDAWDPRFSDE